MRDKKKKITMTVVFILLFSPVKAEELESIPTVGGVSYNIQKYTGFNFIVDHLAEITIKGIIKFKTRAKDVSVDLKIFSGWDLIRKKARSLKISADQLFVKDIPVNNFELFTDGPIYPRVLPVNLTGKLNVSLDNLHTSFREIDFSIPPFGATKITLDDCKVSVDDNGYVQADAVFKSVINPDSEPLMMRFLGNLVLKDKKIIVDNLQSEAEGIFTKDSDIGMSFSEMLEDLINPLIDFRKYEKKGFTIDNVNLLFKSNNLLLEISGRLFLKENEI